MSGTNGGPPEFTKYTNSEGEEYEVSLDGVLLGEFVVSIVNGSLCINHQDQDPDASNFGPYASAILEADMHNGFLGARAVYWHPEERRYGFHRSEG